MSKRKAATESIKVGKSNGITGKVEVKALLRVLKMAYTKYRSELIIVTVCILLSSVTSVLGSMFLKPLIDDYIGPLIGVENPDFSGLATAISVMASIYLVGIISTLIYGQLMVKISQGTLLDVRKQMFDRMQGLPIRFFDQNNNGAIMSYYSNDTDALLNMLAQGVPQLMNTAFSLTAVIVGMFIVNVYLTLFTLLFTVLMVFITKYLGSRSAKNFAKQQEEISRLNAYTEEMVSGQQVIKVFNREDECIDEFKEISTAWATSSFKAVRITSSIGAIMNNLGHLLYVILAIAGGALAIYNGSVELGDIAAFLVLSRNFVMPLGQVAEQVNNIALALAGAERIVNLIDEPIEVDNGYVTLVKAKEVDGVVIESDDSDAIHMWKHPHTDGTLTYAKLEGHIELNEVDFGYIPEKTVLHDVTLTAMPGQKIAFVGATGAGKTTITNLINRFYDIADGKIRYDGININKIKKADLRASLGIVLQDVSLFSGSIKENIRYGRIEATDDEIIDACKRANAHDFIMNLPEKYDTVIDGNAAGLSQGQRQLLSIARAIITNAPLMILDEATSSIDTRTEILVAQGMDSLMEGRTSFVIAHRLSTIKNADVIMVLDQGRIIERGNHNELIAKKGKYFELYQGISEPE